MEVKIKKLTPEARIPSYAHEGDAALDLTAISYEYDSEIDSFIYHTGISIQPPEGYVTLLFPRSSNKKTNCYLTNSVGVVDPNYTGELMLAFKSRDEKTLSKPYNVGDRIAQMMVIPYPKVTFIEVEELDKTDRNAGGFGSTGK